MRTVKVLKFKPEPGNEHECNMAHVKVPGCGIGSIIQCRVCYKYYILKKRWMVDYGGTKEMRPEWVRTYAILHTSLWMLDKD